MIMKTIIYLSTIIFLLPSCIEEYEIEFSKNSSKIVIEGVVTDTSYINYVRLSLSRNSFQYYENDSGFDKYNLDGFIPIKDARVVISDNKGNIDTLINSPDSVSMTIYNDYLQKYITFNRLSEHGTYNGHYQTQKIKGVPGNTYTLTVQWRGEDYKASCYMPKVPEIDSVKYQFTRGSTGKDSYYIPHIWFKDNTATKDYYLFKTFGGNVWGRALLNDDNLKNIIDGLDVFKGESASWWLSAYPPAGSKYKIEMHSITKEIYDYYNSLIMQFRNDGGVYTPAPASPNTNFNNNALGYFRASSVKVIEDTMPLE